MQSHIHKVYACLAVTCHPHFWQNDQDPLRATAVTQGWNGYRNKSQHKKSTPEKKILPPLLQGFELATFQSQVRRSNHWAIPAPLSWCRTGWGPHQAYGQHKYLLQSHHLSIQMTQLTTRKLVLNHYADCIYICMYTNVKQLHPIIRLPMPSLTSHQQIAFSSHPSLPLPLVSLPIKTFPPIC